MKTTLWTMLFVSIFGHAFAQTTAFESEVLSKIQINLSNQEKIVIYTRYLKDLERIRNLDSLLALYKADHNRIQPSAQDPLSSLAVTYAIQPDAQRTLHMKEYPSQKQQYRILPGLDEPILLKEKQDTLCIHIIRPSYAKRSMDYQDPELYVYLLLNDLTNGIDRLDVVRYNELVEQTIKTIHAYPKKNLLSEKFRVEYYGPERVEIKTLPNLRQPFMAFHQTFGVGILGQQFVPNLQTELAFFPNRHSEFGYALGWRFMYQVNQNDLTNSWNTQRNTVFYAGITLYDFSGKGLRKVDPSSPIWGVYLGRVGRQSGTTFERDTWNLSMTIAAKGFVKVQPEVYFDGFFKRNVRPGIRIQMGF